MNEESINLNVYCSSMLLLSIFVKTQNLYCKRITFWQYILFRAFGG